LPAQHTVIVTQYHCFLRQLYAYKFYTPVKKQLNLSLCIYGSLLMDPSIHQKQIRSDLLHQKEQ